MGVQEAFIFFLRLSSMSHRLCWQCDAGLSAGPPQYEYENWHTSAWICPECKSIFVGLSELCNGSF